MKNISDLMMSKNNETRGNITNQPRSCGGFYLTKDHHKKIYDFREILKKKGYGYDSKKIEDNFKISRENYSKNLLPWEKIALMAKDNFNLLENITDHIDIRMRIDGNRYCFNTLDLVHYIENPVVPDDSFRNFINYNLSKKENLKILSNNKEMIKHAELYTKAEYGSRIRNLPEKEAKLKWDRYVKEFMKKLQKGTIEPFYERKTELERIGFHDQMTEIGSKNNDEFKIRNDADDMEYPAKKYLRELKEKYKQDGNVEGLRSLERNIKNARAKVEGIIERGKKNNRSKINF